MLKSILCTFVPLSTANFKSIYCDLFEGNYVINYLATRGPKLQTFVIKSLIQLVCRITKFGWFDDDKFRDIVKEAADFLSLVSLLSVLLAFS
jgi:hypothetical protein